MEGPKAQHLATRSSTQPFTQTGVTFRGSSNSQQRLRAVFLLKKCEWGRTTSSTEILYTRRPRKISSSCRPSLSFWGLSPSKKIFSLKLTSLLERSSSIMRKSPSLPNLKIGWSRGYYSKECGDHPTTLPSRRPSESGRTMQPRPVMSTPATEKSKEDRLQNTGLWLMDRTTLWW